MAWSSTDVTNENWRRGNLHWQLRPTQLEISNWWHGEVEAMLTIVHARRGFGKTWFMLTEAFSFMAKNPGSRQIYAAPTREETKKIVLPTALLLIPEKLDRSVKPVWMASDHLYAHPNGATLVIEGADDEGGNHLRGPFADRVWLDELGFWRMPHYVWTSVLYPQVERRDGRAFGVSTSPVSPQHEFATMLIPEAKADNAYVQVPLEADYTVTQEKRDKIAAQYSKARDPVEGRTSTNYRREYGCEIITEASRAVLPEFDAALHVGEHKRPEFFDGYTVLDLGMTDLTHCLLSYYDFDNATIVIEDEVVRQYCTVSELAPLIAQAEKERWGAQAPRKRISDAQPISLAEFGRQHLLQPNLVPREMRFAAANNRDPEALINRTRTLLVSTRIKINPRCVQLIRQCIGGLWNKQRTDFERAPPPSDSDDFGLGHLDGIMALVYTVDSIDFANNPELAQKKYAPDDHPVHWMKSVMPQSASMDNAQRSLLRLLPKSARKQKVRRL